jgi:hypothetical protein
MKRFILCVVMLIPTATTAAEKPIAVIKIDRKDPVVYEKEIDTIFRNKCIVCHSGKELKGKFDASSYVNVLKGGKSGPAVIAGKSADSLLVKMVGKTVSPAMPPKDEEPLTPQELALIKLWVDQGAKPPSAVVERPMIAIGALPASVTPVRAVAINADKSAIAAGRANQIHLYNAKGDHVKSLVDPSLKLDGKPFTGAHIGMVESLAFSVDGKLLASGGFREVTIWDAQSGAVKQKLTGFADRVVALAFSKTGLLATGGGAATEDGELKIYDAATAKLVIDIKSAHSDTVFGVCFNPDGKMIASCGADKFVKTFDVATGKLVKQFEGHTHHVLDVGWRGDGKFLASAGADNAVKVWDFEKGEQARTMSGHSKQVTRLQFIGATTRIVTCSGDQTVRMWNVESGGTERQFQAGGDFLYAIGVSPDGALVAAGGEDGTVRLYNGQNGQLIKQLLPPGVEAPKK